MQLLIKKEQKRGKTLVHMKHTKTKSPRNEKEQETLR